MSTRVRTDPRISRRRKAVQRSKRRRLALALAVVAGLAALAWMAFWSPVLRVRSVELVGAEHTTSEEVIEVTGLGEDDNLLLLSTAEVADQAETLPWVRAAEVDRMLPDTVRVRVVERDPAVVLSIGAARWTLDARGHVLAPGTVAKNLPVLAGVEVAGIEPGIKLQTEEAMDALRAWRSLPRSLRAKVTGVFAPTLERISFTLANGVIVRYGAAERMEAKNEVLGSVLARLQSQGRAVAYIDVRVPTSPAVLPAVPGTIPTTVPAAE